MNYIGSKVKLLEWIQKEIKSVVGSDLSDKIFCDMFAGSGVVGRKFKRDVKQIISNDLEHYSYVLNRNYIENHILIENSDKYIDELNNLSLIESGFIYQNYCMGSGSKREYFSDDNGKKIDTIRTKIEDYKDKEEISDNLYYFLLASLVESADRVANTASVYGAFLKEMKYSASQELVLKPANFIENRNTHQVHHRDSNDLIKEIKGDILYLDPPYNHRQYGANYHILNTITLYDDFIPKGKTGVRDYISSDYARKSMVHKSFEELIKNAEFQYIFLSYNNNGLMSEDEVKSIMEKYGKYSLSKKEYYGFKKMKTFEYLHVLEK